MTDVKTVKDVLIESRDRIADPAKWTQGTFARDAYNQGVPATAPTATCWCALGSLLRTLCDERNYELRGRLEEKAAGRLHDAARRLYRRTVPQVNDTLDLGDVLKVYDLAIKECPDD